MTASFVLGIDPGKSFFAATLVHSTGERVCGTLGSLTCRARDLRV